MQRLTLDILEQDGLYGYDIAVILNAFNQTVFGGYTFEDPGECKTEGLECVKYIIEMHMENATFELSNVDKDIIVNFFEENQ